jgi:Cof subfamily protein (haloacid dehalogenase superfamily)
MPVASLVALAATALLAPTPRLIVFTDCDGTLLLPDHSLSPATSDMLYTLHDNGVLVVPATGRARAGPWTEEVLYAHPMLKGGNPGIFINGCSAFDEDGQPLASSFLPSAVVQRVLDWSESSREATGCSVVAYVGGEALHTKDSASDDTIRRVAALGDSPPRCVPRVPTDACFKMILCCEDDDEVQRIRPLMEALLCGEGVSNQAALTQALPSYLEVVPSGTSKATAVAELLKRWGLRWDDVVAIGDGGNDVPMLAAAGTSIAMGNAGQAVKSVADHTVGSNADDGWVEAMERFVLSRL